MVDESTRMKFESEYSHDVLGLECNGEKYVSKVFKERAFHVTALLVAFENGRASHIAPKLLSDDMVENIICNYSDSNFNIKGQDARKMIRFAERKIINVVDVHVDYQTCEKQDVKLELDFRYSCN